MNIRRNPVLRSAVEYLEANGAQDIEPYYGGKHIRIKFQFMGQQITTTVPKSPSDHRSGMQQITQIRRLLREASERAS